MVGESFIFGVALICAGVHFLYRNKKGSKSDEWLWTGHGDNPFK